MHFKRAVHRAGGLLLATAALFAVFVAPASAGTDHYCEGATLPAGWSCSGARAHTGLVYVDITTNHTGCAGAASGYGGYNPVPSIGLNTFIVACTSGSGTNGGYAEFRTPLHGAVYNPNQRTGDYIYQAHITFGLV